jgi:ATP-binding cassette subfamily C (CFTR/MRP) protein 1
MEEASFSWDRDATTPTIKNVSLSVEKGKLVAIVGTVGSGKSSLISSFLGELGRHSPKYKRLLGQICGRAHLRTFRD